MTQKEKDEILTTISQMPLSDPTMDSTRNLIVCFLLERFKSIDKPKQGELFTTEQVENIRQEALSFCRNSCKNNLIKELAIYSATSENQTIPICDIRKIIDKVIQD